MMAKFTPKLRVLGVAGIIEPLELDLGLTKHFFVQVALSSGAGDIFSPPSLQAEIDHSFSFARYKLIVPRVGNPRANPEILAHCFYETPVQIRKIIVSAGGIERFKPCCNFLEVIGVAIVLHQGLPMLQLPVRRKLHITNTPVYTASDRHTEPLKPLRRLNYVPVSPVIFRELHVVVNDYLIH